MSYPAAAAGCALMMGVLWLAASRGREAPVRAALQYACAALGGFACAKLGYLCFFAPGQWARWGVRALWLCRPGTFSFVGGMLGVCGGLAAGARWTRAAVRPVLDRFAPLGALLAAAFRLLERLLGTVGAGALLPDGHPAAGTWLALTNAWGEWFWAVCVLEAACALLVFFWSVTAGRRTQGRWLRALAALCAGQMFFEVLRSNTASWHFVRIDQLWSAAVLLTVVIRGAVRRREAGLVRRWGWTALALAMIGLNAWAQFVLDKPYLLTDHLGDAAAEAALSRLRPLCLAAVLVSAAGLGLAAARSLGRANQ